MTVQQNSIGTPITCPHCGAGLEQTAKRFDCPSCHVHLILHSCHVAVSEAQIDRPIGGLLPFDLPDPGAGVPVLSMLIPAGWSWTGGAQWTTNPVQAARIHFLLRDTHCLTALEGLPADYFGWTSDQSMQNRIPIGGNYYGMEFQPPATAMEVLKSFLLPRYRPIPGLQIITQEPVDALIQDISCNLKARGDTAMVDAFRVRLCYTLDQIPLFEQVEGVILTSRKLSPGRYGTVEQVNWCTSGVYACRARQDQFERWEPVFRHMIDSIQINSHWQAFYQQTVQRLSQQAQLHVRQAYDKKHSLEAQSAQEDFLQSERVRSIRSMRVADLSNDLAEDIKVELPDGYRQVWSNGRGEFILSDDPDYYPNASGFGVWSQIEPAKKE